MYLKTFRTLLLVGSLFGANAFAADRVLTLTGSVSNAFNSSFESGGTRFEFWTLELEGLTAMAPLPLAQGDTVSATITLDAPATVPTAASFSVFELTLLGSFAGNTGALGTMNFFLGGLPVLAWGTGSQLTNTSGQITASVAAFPPDNVSFSFDKVVSNFVVTTLAAPGSATDASIRFALASPVPEPGSYALMLLGLAGLGLRVCRRRSGEVAWH